MRMRVLCISALLLLGAATPGGQTEAALLENVRIENIRLVVHAQAIEIIEDISMPSSAIEREVFVALPLVALPNALEVSLVDPQGREMCPDLSWRRLPQKTRSAALLHGSAHESGVAFALRACAGMPASERLVVRLREAYVRTPGARVLEWHRSLGQAGVEPSPLVRLKVERGEGVPPIEAVRARFNEGFRRDDSRPLLYVEGDIKNAEPTAADPTLVRRTGSDRLQVRLTFEAQALTP